MYLPLVDNDTAKALARQMHFVTWQGFRPNSERIIFLPMNGFMNDLRHALRGWRTLRLPGVALLTLALGIGVNARSSR